MGEIKQQPGSLTCNRFNVLRRITEIWGAGFGMSREFFRAGHDPRDGTGRLTMQSDCEPVSAPNSLLTGKLTGNFAQSSTSISTSSQLVSSMASSRIPPQRNRIFSNAYQGIFFGGTGK